MAIRSRLRLVRRAMPAAAAAPTTATTTTIATSHGSTARASHRRSARCGRPHRPSASAGPVDPRRRRSSGRNRGRHGRVSDAKVRGANAWRSTSRCASRAADQRARAVVARSAQTGRDRVGGIGRGQHRGHAERLVVVGRPVRAATGRARRCRLRRSRHAGRWPRVRRRRPCRAPRGGPAARGRRPRSVRSAAGRRPRPSRGSAARAPGHGTAPSGGRRGTIRGRARWHTPRPRPARRAVPRPPDRGGSRWRLRPPRARPDDPAAGTGRWWPRTRSAAVRRRPGDPPRRARASRRGRGRRPSPRPGRPVGARRRGGPVAPRRGWGVPHRADRGRRSRAASAAARVRGRTACAAPGR